jgi:diketogulonate reductase-like aldo/keto reductase
LTKSIGLSNFNKTQIAEVHAIARIPISTLQNECHPYLQQKDLIDFCNFHKIAFQAFSPLGSGDTNLAVGDPKITSLVFEAAVGCWL